MSYLPRIGPSGVRAGRKIGEGYQRGWGIQYGDLRAQVRDDPDYLRAIGYAADRTVVDDDRMMNLFLIMKFYVPKLFESGNIIEFGSYRGGSAFFLAALARQFLRDAQVYALDTFAGMPHTNADIDAHNAGDFSETNINEIERAKKDFCFDNVHFIQGLFQKTAPSVLKRAKKIALAHIDCDIYESVCYAYDTCTPYMLPGGYLIFDDSTTSSCIGATEAVEAVVIKRDGLLSEQIWPHHVFRAPGLG